MIAVAVMAIALACVVRGVAYQHRADELDQQSSKVVEHIRVVDRSGGCFSWTLGGKDRDDFIREAKELRLKRDEYRSVAWRPWVSMP
jgi:hypothetical protein